MYQITMSAKKREVITQSGAKATGVSVSTVSRLLNGKVDVESDTPNHIFIEFRDVGGTGGGQEEISVS